MLVEPLAKGTPSVAGGVVMLQSVVITLQAVQLVLSGLNIFYGGWLNTFSDGSTLTVT